MVSGAAASPYETDQDFVPINRIDEIVLAGLREAGLEPAALCSDAVFLRRAHLDVTGALPDPVGARQFIRDQSPDKRVRLIERLLESDGYADYGSLRWCDMLRVKAEFPINLWPNGVQAYHRWVYASLRDNKPVDRMARELLTSSGSNFRVAPVNFYRAMQGHEPSTIARAVGLTFLGERVDDWPAARREGFEALFSRVAFKGTAEWKEEIVFLDPAPRGALNAVLPDGRAVRIAEGEDPRVVFADWLLDPANPRFARNIVNRQWAWLFGRGIVHEPDDFRADNPPAHPELLDYLAAELIDSDYDLKHVYRLILNSATYQQSCLPRGDIERSEALFACYPVRRLDAEVLVDALNSVLGGRESYSSAIPEPFTFVPEAHPTVELADGSITSQFLEMFGRPTRDTGLWSERNNQTTAAQCMHLLNSTNVQSKIERSYRLRGLIRLARGNKVRLIQGLYLTTLSRHATPDEVSRALEVFESGDVRQGTQDLAWALVNSKEFLHQH